jgi:hypothetical protein
LYFTFLFSERLSLSFPHTWISTLFLKVRQRKSS